MRPPELFARVGFHIFAGLIILGLALCLRAGELPDAITEDVTRFTALLDSPAEERKVEGIQGLSHLKHWPAERRILPLLSDPSFAVRREALLALSRLGTSQSVPALIDLLGDSSWELRENARLALEGMTGRSFASNPLTQWRTWWTNSSPAGICTGLLAVIRGTNVPVTYAMMPRGAAWRALRHLAIPEVEATVLDTLQRPATPPWTPDELAFAAAVLERIGTERAVPLLAGWRTEPAAWALGRIGGVAALQALHSFPPSLATLLNLDRLGSTNAGPFIPFLVSHMGLVTYRSQPDDLMNSDAQPVQRAAANLIRRSGQAPLLVELVLQELEDSMKPPISHGPRPAAPENWNTMLASMREELKPGFVRNDGVTTSQPLAALSFVASDPALAPRLLPLLRHPAFVPRIYVGLLLGRLRAPEAVPRILEIIREDYPFSDSTALASGKHFDQSQTVRWRGFLCMALGRMGTDAARQALENLASDPQRPRDIRYSAVVGLGFIASPESLPVLRQVAQKDIIWMVRHEAQRVLAEIQVLQKERT